MDNKIKVCDGKGGILLLTPQECVQRKVKDFSGLYDFLDPGAGDRYDAGKSAQADENLLAEMGSGPRAFRLPAPYDYEPAEDGFYAYNKYTADHG